MRIRQRLHPGHLDEIAGLLANGYVRLRRKPANLHTSSAHSLDARAGSLDSICQAERSWAGHHALKKEAVNGDLARS